MALIKRNNGGFFNFRPTIADFFDDNGFFLDKVWNTESVPAVNISEDEKNYEIELAVPGMKKNDFKVKIENNMLTISAEHKEEKEEKKKNYTRQEYRFDSFTRSFTLPENAKEDGIEAHYEDGVLKLKVAKKVVVTSKAKEVMIS
jgi:HSP20 family protein